MAGGAEFRVFAAVKTPAFGGRRGTHRAAQAIAPRIVSRRALAAVRTQPKTPQLHDRRGSAKIRQAPAEDWPLTTATADELAVLGEAVLGE